MRLVPPSPPGRAAIGSVAQVRTLAIIPAYNEELALPAVLDELQAAHPTFDIVVIDDGSRDRTAEVARRPGVTVLRLPFNLGIGGALRMGFRYAVEQGYDRGFQFDADGQHEAGQVPLLLAELDAGADMAIGSRFAGEGDYRVGRSRGLAMGFLRWGLKRLSGRRFTDTSSGFRAFDRRVLELFAAEYPAEYMESVEALVIALRDGCDVREVPVRMRERAAGQPSNRRFRLVYHYLRLLVVLVASPRRSARPAA